MASISLCFTCTCSWCHTVPRMLGVAGVGDEGVAMAGDMGMADKCVTLYLCTLSTGA